MVRRAADSFMSAGQSLELWIVDNSPTDALRSVANSVGANYVFVPQNLGFGAGHNLAIQNIANRARYHVVLNPDVYFDGLVLKELFEFMESHENVGLVMPHVLNPDGSTQYLCKLVPAPLDVLGRRFFPYFLKRIIRKRLERFECRHLDLTQVAVVPCLSGCFMFLRRNHLERVGGFDPRFFMYFEDFDLSRRMALEGLTVFYPFTHIYHEHAKGSYRSARLLKLHVKAGFQYFSKHGWLFDRNRNLLNERAGTGPFEQASGSLEVMNAAQE